MRQNVLYVTFIVMIMSEKIFKKPENQLKITSEEAVMKVDNKVVIHEKININ